MLQNLKHTKHFFYICLNGSNDANNQIYLEGKHNIENRIFG